MLSIDTFYPIFKKCLLVVLDAVLVTFFDWLDASIIVKHYFLTFASSLNIFHKKVIVIKITISCCAQYDHFEEFYSRYYECAKKHSKV